MKPLATGLNKDNVCQQIAPFYVTCEIKNVLVKLLLTNGTKVQWTILVQHLLCHIFSSTPVGAFLHGHGGAYIRGLFNRELQH